MEQISGFSNSVLCVDVTRRTWSIETINEKERKHYLGGKGLGLKLLYDKMPPGLDPLGAENILAVMPGVMTATDAPCSERFTVISKSPLTGIMVTSSCGGPFGVQLRAAGYDGLIIKGKSDKRCIIYFDHESVEFRDARDVWGLDTIETQRFLAKDDETALVIGPAGENLVRFANIASGSQFFGRGGLGAVMGSKNIKAIIAGKGKFRITPARPERFKQLVKKAAGLIGKDEVASTMEKFGTAVNLQRINRAGLLPVWNYFLGHHDQAFRISGEMIHGKHRATQNACLSCNIRCGHNGRFKIGTVPVPEYETLVMLGSNIGIFDREYIVALVDICNRLGMDTISVGGVLAWVMEATEKGYVKTDLAFGLPYGIGESLENIAFLKGLGQDMALGTRGLSEKYGGQEFAMHVKGLEMDGYDPRGAFGQGLAYAVANPGGCHQSAFLLAFEVQLNLLRPDTWRAKPVFVKFTEDLICAVNALQLCRLSMYPFLMGSCFIKYMPRFLLRFLMNNFSGGTLKIMCASLYANFFSAVTGMDMSGRELLEAGERIHILERLMNTREGISRKDDTLPDRMLFECMQDDPAEKTVPLEQMLDKYYKKRGYHLDGTPTQSTLNRLQII